MSTPIESEASLDSGNNAHLMTKNVCHHLNLYENEDDEYLHLKNIYGCDKLAADSIRFIGEKKFVYLVGCNLVSVDCDGSRQKLTSFTCAGRVQAFALSQDKKKAVLVCLEQKSSCLILLHIAGSLSQRQKNLPNFLVKCMSVSSSQDLIACQSSAESDWSLKVFSLKTLKCLGEANPIGSLANGELTVEEISFVKSDNRRILLVGHKLVKIFQLGKDALKLVLNVDCSARLERHSWLNRSEFVCIDKFGDCYLIEPKQNSAKPLVFVSSLKKSQLYQGPFQIGKSKTSF